MTPYKSRAAVKNLRAGIKKMENTMTPAALVRREFRLGRPPKPVEDPAQLKHTVVWKKASDALADLRARMSAAGLRPEHVGAEIVYVTQNAPDTPERLLMCGQGRTDDEWRDEALSRLAQDDVIVLGMLFTQFDEQSGTQAIFPHLFVPLNARGMDVLKREALRQHNAIAQLKAQH